MRQLNFHHLHYFWTVAKEGHLTRSAQKLNVSQSALSAQIKLLEEQLGHPLFHRQGRQLVLTDLGQRVFAYAESIFRLGGELLSMVASGEHARVQQLRVGAVSTLSRNFQENFLRPLFDQPEVRLIMRAANLEALLEQLQSYQLDVVLSNKSVPSHSSTPWRCRLIAKQQVCLVGPPLPELQSLRWPAALQQLKVLVPGEDSGTRAQFDLFCAQHGITITPYAEVDDMAMLRLLARDTGAIAVVPAVVVQDELRSGTLHNYLTLENVSEHFYAITAKRHFELPLLQQLLAHA